MKKIGISIFIILSYCLVAPATQAQSLQNILAIFRQVITVQPIDVRVPTVVDTEYTGQQNSVIVVEQASRIRVPSVLVSEQEQIPHVITRNNTGTEYPQLMDRNTQTFIDFPISESMIDEDGEETVELRFAYSRPISTSSFAFTLDRNVSVPEYIAIETEGVNGNNIVVFKQRLNATTVYFPQQTNDTFIVRFYFRQPLRISEAGFTALNSESKKYIRFLAQPQRQYHIYIHPDGQVPYLPPLESGDMNNPSLTVLKVPGDVTLNPAYQPSDRDGDGIPDTQDNCPTVPNPNQEDVNNNGIGDACEDFDLDGIINAEDNCPDVPNRLQQDEDGDGVGDHCDDEESRLIEQLSFIPWLGIIVGFGVVILLFKFTIQKT